MRDYRWSSYPAYAGYAAAPPWLRVDEVLSRAGGGARYKHLAETKVGRGLEESMWSGLKWGLVLGGESFAEQIRAQLKTSRESSGRRELRKRRSWREVVRAVEAARGERWEEFAGRHGDPGLALALYVGRRCTGMTLRALGEAAGGMDYAPVAGKNLSPCGESYGVTL